MDREITINCFFASSVDEAHALFGRKELVVGFVDIPIRKQDARLLDILSNCLNIRLPVESIVSPFLFTHHNFSQFSLVFSRNLFLSLFIPYRIVFRYKDFAPFS